MFHKKAALKKFTIFTGKHLCRSLFDKVAGLQLCNFIKKRLQHRWFSVKIVKFLRTPKNHLQTTAFVNSRMAIFQESLALSFKQNALTSGICNLGKLVQQTQVQTGSQGFNLPYSPERFSKFQAENTCFVFSKSLEFLFFLILFSAGLYLLKVWLKHSQNGNIILLFLFSSGI